MEKYSEQISSHPFLKEALLDSSPVLDRLTIMKSKGTQGTQIVSESEQYFLYVAYYAIHLCSSFTRLEHIRAFLAHIRILKQYKEIGITRKDYIQYHYSNHAVTLVGLFDIALILTSNVLRLGLPEKQCRSETIIQNSWVRSCGIDKILQNMDSTLKPLREPRNLFLHRGCVRQDEFLPILGIYELLTKGGISQKTITYSDMALAYKEEVSDILNELSKQEEPVFDISMELLHKLHPVYKFWKKFLAKQEKQRATNIKMAEKIP